MPTTATQAPLTSGLKVIPKTEGYAGGTIKEVLLTKSLSIKSLLYVVENFRVKSLSRYLRSWFDWLLLFDTFESRHQANSSFALQFLD
jgi:hypothetical protein